MTRRLWAPGALWIALFLATFALAGCPSGDTGIFSTPDGAFRATRAAIEAGNYSVAWDAMSVRCRQDWIAGTDAQKVQFRRAGPNYEVFEQFLFSQFGVTGETFLSTDARRLFDIYLEHNREKVLAFEIEGEPRIEGDTAYVFVAPGDGGTGSEWRYVRDVDRWLLDRGLGEHSGPR